MLGAMCAAVGTRQTGLSPSDWHCLLSCEDLSYRNSVVVKTGELVSSAVQRGIYYCKDRKYDVMPKPSKICRGAFSSVRYRNSCQLCQIQHCTTNYLGCSCFSCRSPVALNQKMRLAIRKKKTNRHFFSPQILDKKNRQRRCN